MMNILLTGSGGFIGLHLKQYLGAKYNLFTPRSKDLNLLDESAVDNFFHQNKIDFIIHSAAAGVRITPDAKKEDVAITNIKMFDNLARHVSKKCPMIVFGSGAEYDKSRPLIYVSESEFGQKIPSDPYGFSKYEISKKIEKMDNILNLRVFGIYGYGENPTRVTTCIIQDYINHHDIQLNQNVRFHFIYIDDFCKIVEYFIKNFPTEKFINIAPTDSIETKDLAKIVNSFDTHTSNIVFRQPGNAKEYTADNALLLKLLRDFKFTTYETGMKKLYKDLSK